MATTIAVIVANARTNVNESTASFWTDAELLVHAVHGIKDLWRSVKDTLQDHFFTILADGATLYQDTDGTTITGVPADVAEVRLLEPYDLATYPSIIFRPLAYNHPDFQNARGQTSQSPNNGGVIYYAITGAGGPVGAPTIYVAPKLSGRLHLRLMYVPNIGVLTSASNNPVPGESDKAVECWICAYALGKQNPDSTFTPDATWMEMYKAEKDKIITAVTPRQTQEVQIAEALFESYW